MTKKVKVSRAQRKYDNIKAQSQIREANRQAMIDEIQESPPRKRYTTRELNTLGYHRNWRGKWVEN